MRQVVFVMYIISVMLSDVVLWNMRDKIMKGFGIN